MYAPATSLAFLNSIGPWELVVIGLIALIVFGKRLPEVGRSLGKGIVEFKKGLHETGEEINASANAPPPPSAPKREQSSEKQPGNQ